MKKITAILVIIILTSFQTKQISPNLFHYDFTSEEVGLIYLGLGKLPAEQSEQLRAKIAYEFQKQSDTTKQKPK